MLIETSLAFSSEIVAVLFVVYFALLHIKSLSVLQQLSFSLPLKVNFHGGDVQVNNLKNDLFLFLLCLYKLMGRKEKGWSDETWSDYVLWKHNLVVFYIW